LDVLAEGRGERLGWHDPDEQRAWVREHKPRDLHDKRMSIAEAVERFVPDGALLAMGGFGHVRVSMAAVYEMIRQHKKGLALIGKTATHDADLLISAGVVDRVDVAYTFGHELRGLSPASRRALAAGRCHVVAESSNAAHQWRFLAAMMGLPFMPMRSMLATDTLAESAAVVVTDPFSGKPICLVPALYPDVTFIHVSRCDLNGNAQIDGTLIEDFELARAARRVVITAEEIISEEEIRRQPWRTSIPFFLVDAVVEAPNGCHPCHLPLHYAFDEDHIGEWLAVSQTDEGVAGYFARYVHGVPDFAAYLELVGGREQMERLADAERRQAPNPAPWLKKAGG
jgi:3-oxoacid CoA-transferase subunit A/glutaconate CoA-transferase subunit A